MQPFAKLLWTSVCNAAVQLLLLVFVSFLTRHVSELVLVSKHQTLGYTVCSKLLKAGYSSCSPSHIIKALKPDSDKKWTYCLQPVADVVLHLHEQVVRFCQPTHKTVIKVSQTTWKTQLTALDHLDQDQWCFQEITFAMKRCHKYHCCHSMQCC